MLLKPRFREARELVMSSRFFLDIAMRQAMELVDQLRHEVEDIKGGAADGGGKQGGDGGEEKRVLIDELECARLELDASEDARRELEGVVAAANQETDALRKRLADFEAELRRGEFAGSLNDRLVFLLFLSLIFSFSLFLSLSHIFSFS